MFRLHCLSLLTDCSNSELGSRLPFAYLVKGIFIVSRLCVVTRETEAWSFEFANTWVFPGVPRHRESGSGLPTLAAVRTFGGILRHLPIPTPDSRQAAS